MNKIHYAIIGTILAAATAAGAALWLTSAAKARARTELLGQKFHDPQLRLTYYPPVRWHAVPPADELLKHFSGDQKRLIAHFEGPNPGDQADLVLIKASDRLRQVREQVISQKNPKTDMKVIVDEFRHLNTVPAWVYEYMVRQGPFVVYSIYVVLDRGDRKVVLSCTGSPKSLESQR
ncbi:MAG TPA: hypothetical protein VM223_11655, partial [Planctomycetota bacterium]|nr:hypothetical protein [Planctomycetota bacterium]